MKEITYILIFQCLFLLGVSQPVTANSIEDVHRGDSVFFYIDKGVENASALRSAVDNYALYNGNQEFHLFAHGRPGELLIEGQWLDTLSIINWLNNNNVLKEQEQLNIYGCNFGKGVKGERAVKFLEKVLRIKVAASTNITGKEGDWTLELGKTKGTISVIAYDGNLQDRDNDSIIDSKDIDDDNDGILDIYEGYELLPLPGHQLASNPLVFNCEGVSNKVTFTTVGGEVGANGHSFYYREGGVGGSTNDTYTFEFEKPVKEIRLWLDNVITYAPIGNFLVTYEDSTVAGNLEFLIDSNIYSLPVTSGTQGVRGIVSGFNAFVDPSKTYYPQENEDQLYGTIQFLGLDAKKRIKSVSFTRLGSASIGVSARIVPVVINYVDDDSDGVPNHLDLDSDNDGCFDSYEAGVIGATSSGVATDSLAASMSYEVGENGFADVLETAEDGLYKQRYSYSKAVNNRIINCLDTDNDGLLDAEDVDDDNDGIPDEVEILAARGLDGTDGDGIPDQLDLDSDNDGIPDLVEAGGVDRNGDGLVDELVDVDNDGLVDAYDTDSAGIQIGALDTDGDGRPDRVDLDSDNDGINDQIEGGLAEIDAEGLFARVDGGFSESKTNELAHYPVDTDEDGIPDFRDLDSDDDGVLDIEESGNLTADTDSNGVADGADTDGDGVLDALDDDVHVFGDHNELGSAGDLSAARLATSGGIGLVADSGTDADGDGIASSVDSDDTVFGLERCGGATLAYAISDGQDNTTGFLLHRSADVQSAAKFGTSRSTAYCESEGWRHYFNANEPDKMLFSVEMGANTTEIDYIDIRISERAADRYHNSATSALFGLQRDWHLQTVDGAALTAPVNIRFYYPPAELEGMLSDAKALAAKDPEAPALSHANVVWFVKDEFDPLKDFSPDASVLEMGTGFTVLTPRVAPHANGKSEANASRHGNNVNYVQFDGVTSLGGGGVYVTFQGEALPVELSTFVADAEGCATDLRWKTAVEHNLAYVDVERSADGKMFEKVAKVDLAEGDLTGSFLDQGFMTSNQMYYRLKLVLESGTSNYTEAVAVQTDCWSGNVSLYPNPISRGQASLLVDFYADRSAAKVQVQDIFGRVVQEYSYDTSPGTKNSIRVDVTHLPMGNYMLSLADYGLTKMFTISE